MTQLTGKITRLQAFEEVLLFLDREINHFDKMLLTYEEGNPVHEDAILRLNAFQDVYAMIAELALSK